MQSRWHETAAREAVVSYGARGADEHLALRTYSARLIGGDPQLVLHGGGNTSVKATGADLHGREIELMYIKGSGWDLGTIDLPGHPAVRMAPLLALQDLPALSDEDMVNQLRLAMLDLSGPTPSVETLLHAFIPERYIDHTHADAALSVLNQENAEAAAAEAFGPDVAVLPYQMPGFELSLRAAASYAAAPGAIGMALVHHGLVTWGATARESYERMIELVQRAEAYLASREEATETVRGADLDPVERAPVLRGAIAKATGQRRVLAFRTSDAIRAFVDHPDLHARCGQAPPTPDHVIRTRRLPLVVERETDIAAALATYAEREHEAFVANCASRGVDRSELPPVPGVALVPGAGLYGIGGTLRAAEIAADLYEHTVKIITDAEQVGRYQPLDPLRLFDMEYWSLEQAKLGSRSPAPFEGQIALVTGAASGIGAATARRLAADGALVVLWDLDAAGLEGVAADCAASHAQVVDVTDPEAVKAGIRVLARQFGGLDLVVSNAGRALSAPIASCDAATMRAELEMNLLSHQYVASAAVTVMQRQSSGGCLLFNASKSAFNPGPGFGPYSIPKAGVIALMKQYALEHGADGIRSNAVNADRVRTGLFGDGLLESRAAARGLSVEAYMSGNLLQQEVLAEDVAAAFVALAGQRCTSGAVLPVDGGNIAASPR